MRSIRTDHRKPTLSALAAYLLSALFAPDAQAWRLDWVAELGYEHNDNVNLSETDPVSTNIVRPSLGFVLSQEGATVQASARGFLAYRNYLGDEYDSEFLGELDSIVNWVIAPERLHFSVQDRLSILPISQATPDSPENQQQTNVFAAGPTFFFRFSPTFRGQVELRWIDTYAEETVGFNTERLFGALRLIKMLGQTRQVSFNVQAHDVDVDDNALAPDYQRYDVFGRYSQALSHFDLALELGYSWLEYDDGGSRSSPLARIIAAWHPNERHSFTAIAARRFSDTAAGMIEPGGSEDGAPPSLPPIVIIGENDAVTALAYEETSLEVGYGYTGARATFGIAPFYRQLDYVDVGNAAGPDQTGRGVTGYWTWRLRPTWSLTGDLRVERLAFDDADFDIDTRTASIWLRKEWTPHWSGRIGYSRYERDNSQTDGSADQNVVYAAVTYTR